MSFHHSWKHSRNRKGIIGISEFSLSVCIGAVFAKLAVSSVVKVLAPLRFVVIVWYVHHFHLDINRQWLQLKVNSIHIYLHHLYSSTHAFHGQSDTCCLLRISQSIQNACRDLFWINYSLQPVEQPKQLLDFHSKRVLPSCRPWELLLQRDPFVVRKAIRNIG